MKKKQYKVKIENGQIKPLEPMDLRNIKEGIIIFFEEEFDNTDTDPKPLLEMVGSITAETDYEKLTPELIDSVVYDEQ